MGHSVIINLEFSWLSAVFFVGAEEAEVDDDSNEDDLTTIVLCKCPKAFCKYDPSER